MKQFYIIRHTTPDIESGICYGNSNLNVNKHFNEEATFIKNKLKDIHPHAVHSSPLIRCSKLAQFLFPDQQIAYQTNLQELNFGDWEMKKWEEINKKEMDSWYQDFMNQCPPNGESFRQLYERVSKSFDQIANSAQDNSTTAIVCHSGTIRCLAMKYLEIPWHKIFSLQLPFGALIKITWHSKEYQQVEFL
jgi:alpha-ribazole phosphatase